MRIANNDDRNSGGFGFSFDYNRGWQLEFSDNGSIVVQDPFKEVVETGDEIRIKVTGPPGSRFVKWSDGFSGKSSDFIWTANAHVKAEAIQELDFDYNGYRWSTSLSQHWEIYNAHRLDALKTTFDGPIEDDRLSTSFLGSGHLSFRWKSDVNFRDHLKMYVDGVLTAEYAESFVGDWSFIESFWEYRTIKISGSGMHRIDFVNEAKADTTFNGKLWRPTAIIDEIRFTPLGLDSDWISFTKNSVGPVDWIEYANAGGSLSDGGFPFYIESPNFTELGDVNSRNVIDFYELNGVLRGQFVVNRPIFDLLGTIEYSYDLVDWSLLEIGDEHILKLDIDDGLELIDAPFWRK